MKNKGSGLLTRAFIFSKAATDGNQVATEAILMVADDIAVKTDVILAATHDIPVATDAIPIETNDISVKTDVILAATDAIPIETNDISVKTDVIPTAVVDIPISTYLIPTAANEISLETDVVPTASDDISMSTKSILSATDNILVATEVVSMVTDEIPLATDIPTTTEVFPATTGVIPSTAGVTTIDDIPVATDIIPLAAKGIAMATDVISVATHVISANADVPIFTTTDVFTPVLSKLTTTNVSMPDATYLSMPAAADVILSTGDGSSCFASKDSDCDESDLDDSVQDPDYRGETYCSETSEEDFDLLKKSKRKSVKNRLNSKRQKLTCNTLTNCGSPSSSDRSVVIPNISRFLSNETNESPADLLGTEQPCTHMAKQMDGTHKTGMNRMGLLPKRKKQKGCKNVYDKVNYCTYCSKAIHSKISRHLLTVHKTESRVNEILTLTNRSATRMVKLEMLCNEGNFKHNVEVLRKKDGFLAVGRRENKRREFQAGDYLPCNFCKKFLLKRTFWSHQRNCSVKKFNNQLLGTAHDDSGNAVSLSRRLLNSAVMDEKGITMATGVIPMSTNAITVATDVISVATHIISATADVPMSTTTDVFTPVLSKSTTTNVSMPDAPYLSMPAAADVILPSGDESRCFTSKDSDCDESDLDDNVQDPGYREETYYSETSEEAFDLLKKSTRKLVNKCLNSKRQKIPCNILTKCDSGSPSSSDKSVVFPNLSRFLSNETNESPGDLLGTEQPCTHMAKQMDGTHKTGMNRLGLLPKRKKQKGCKNVYDKVNYCTYCSKAIHSKISRHLLNVHKTEPRVNEILTFPNRSATRMVKLEILCNEGNFKHNVEVLRKKDGFLVVGRRDNKRREFQAGDYLPCHFCKRFLFKKTLWLHQRNCSVKQINNQLRRTAHDDSGNAVRLSRRLLNSAVLDEIDPGISTLLSHMQPDEITEHVKKDNLIRRYAALKVESLGRTQDQKITDMRRVSQSCRTLARLVIGCREENDTIINLNQLISPNNFDLIISCTKSLCLGNEKAAPSIGKLIGNNLTHVIQVKKGVALRNGDEHSLQEAENFQQLFGSEWNYRINSVFQKMTNTIKRQKIKTIPLTEDLQKIHQHIHSGILNASSFLKESPTSKTWTRLAKLILCRLIMFNKRRTAEVKDLKVKDYLMHPNLREEQQGDFKMALSLSDRMLAERMDMVICAGKSRKNVDAYVIVPPDARQAIDLMNSTRELIGIPPSNPYIFARLNSDTPLSGNSDMREIVAELPGLSSPERVTSTDLRRYIATVNQILDMTENELDTVTRHLGLDKQKHRHNYLHSHATRELTVVSQLLVAVDSGCVNKWKGKRLAAISVEELPDVEEEDEDEDEVSERAEALLAKGQNSLCDGCPD